MTTQVRGFPEVLYRVHVATWMLLGMRATYLWDSFSGGALAG